MKKVFSVKKFEECCKRLGLPNEEFEKSCEIWANRCDGLTKEEMNELGYVFNDNWAIEVEERKMKEKNEPSKWEIILMAQLVIAFVYETVNELMKKLDFEEEEEEEEEKKE